MTWRVLGLLSILALLSCSTAPKMDPLEAKAAESDPVAACQFAARNIHACALEKQKWERAEVAAKPLCLAEPAGAKAESYLDKAEVMLKSSRPDASIKQLSSEVRFLTQRVHLLVTEVVVMTGTTDTALAETGKLQQQCGELSDGV